MGIWHDLTHFILGIIEKYGTQVIKTIDFHFSNLCKSSITDNSADYIRTRIVADAIATQ